MYSLNVELLRRLSKSLGLSQRDFSEQTFGRQQTWPQRMTFFDRLLLTDLVTISNRWHIPIRWFFCKDNEPCTIPRMEEIIRQGEWQEVYIDTEAFRNIYARSPKGFTREDVQKALDVTGSCIWRWVTVKFTMRAQDACVFCNTTQSDLADFIIDHNWKDASSDDTNQNENAPSTSETCAEQLACGCTEQQLTGLHQEQACLQEKVKALQNSIDEMRAAMQALHENTATQGVSALAVLRATDFAGNTGVFAPYQWNAGKWGADATPTLAEVVDRCNAEQRSTADYLLSDMAAIMLRRQSCTCHDGGFQGVSIDRNAFSYVMSAFGLPQESPESLSVQTFCDAINMLHLTPNCCIREAHAAYPRLFADEMVQALSK